MKNKKSIQQKSSSTRARRTRFLSQYSKLAEKNRLRLNYDIIKKLDKKSRLEKISFKKTFESHLKESDQNKIYYIRKKYNVDKIDAKKILSTSKKKHISYKKSKEVIVKPIIDVGVPERFIRDTSWIGIINTIRDSEYLKKITIDMPEAGIVFTGNKEEFLSQVPKFRDKLETYFKDEYDDDELDSPTAWVMENILEIEWNKFELEDPDKLIIRLGNLGNYYEEN